MSIADQSIVAFTSSGMDFQINKITFGLDSYAFYPLKTERWLSAVVI